MDYEELEKLSLEESKRQTFTFDEKKLLWDGLREDNKTLHEMAMEGFNEEQTLRRIEERNGF